MKAFLDGMPVTSPNESLDKPTLTLRRKDDTGEKAISFAGDLLFSGADFTYIYAKLVSSPSALDNKIVLRLENDCCVPALIYEFYITHESLQWCEGACELTCAAIEKSSLADQITCLKNTLIWDNYAGFQSKAHPRFSYCNELRPNWMHDVMLILAVATYTSILVIGPMIVGLTAAFNTINVLISALNSVLPSSAQINPITVFGGQTNIDFNDLQSYFNLLNSFIVGCGRKHPSPLVRDYADNVCNKCGIAYQSSVFKNVSSDYHNTCFVNAPIHKGTQEADTTTYWVDENKPFLNGTKFFDMFKGAMNLDYKIKNNILYHERRDYFPPKTPWIDLTTYSLNDISVCWEWGDKTRYSYMMFEYFKDGVNWVGGEANARWCSDIVDWNVPYSPLQKDEFHPICEFSACRFRDDGIDRDVLSSYEWAPTFGSIIKKYKQSILMNSHTCYQPMLLIWDGVDAANAKVTGSNVFFSGYPGVGLNQFYNYPFWFNANYPGNLYDRFWFIENPRLSGFQGMKFTADLIFDCNLAKLVDIEGMVNTSRGVGETDSVVLDHKTNQMTIKGTV